MPKSRLTDNYVKPKKSSIPKNWGLERNRELNNFQKTEKIQIHKKMSLIQAQKVEISGWVTRKIEGLYMRTL